MTIAIAEELQLKSSPNLMELSLEELLDVKITSVSKKEEDPFQAAAAVYVISKEDIRRSGASNIPEMLRLVPGMQVARIDSNAWAITARGFNSRFASKLLVLMDGRTVYNSLFSGVYWDTQDTVLEDIERIEVIRGPGGSIWGANAVNGVINIITKNANATQGGLISAGAGKEETGFGTIRYGGKINEDTAFRVYGKYFSRDNFQTLSRTPAQDDWNQGRGGFRTDSQVSDTSKLTVQGDFYQGESDDMSANRLTGLAPPTTSNSRQNVQVSGANLITRWQKELSSDSNLALQFFYNRERRKGSNVGDIILDTYDLDFQHRFEIFEGHDLVWGLGQRFVVDSFDNSFSIGLIPDGRMNYVSSAFIQDEFFVIPERLRLIFGSKLSGNNYTGFEFQPNARMVWTPHEQHVLWLSASRAVRTPSRAEESSRINSRFTTVTGGRTALVSLFGTDGFKSEDLFSVEAGYRFKMKSDFSVDVATYFNSYKDLRTLEPKSVVVETAPMPTHILVPVFAENKGLGDAVGVEVDFDWKLKSWWTLKGGFNWMDLDLYTRGNSTDTTFVAQELSDPEFQWNLRSYLDLPHHLEFDTMLFYVDNLAGRVPEYLRLDLRLGWKPRDDLELSFQVQNAQGASHQEFGSDTIQFISRSRVERSWFGKMTWQF